MHVIVLPVELPQFRADVAADLPEASWHRRSMSASSTPRGYIVTKDQMDVERGDQVPATCGYPR